MSCQQFRSSHFFSPPIVNAPIPPPQKVTFFTQLWISAGDKWFFNLSQGISLKKTLSSYSRMRQLTSDFRMKFVRLARLRATGLPFLRHFSRVGMRERPRFLRTSTSTPTNMPRGSLVIGMRVSPPFHSKSPESQIVEEGRTDESFARPCSAPHPALPLWAREVQLDHKRRPHGLYHGAWHINLYHVRTATFKFTSDMMNTIADVRRTARLPMFWTSLPLHQAVGQQLCLLIIEFCFTGLLITYLINDFHCFTMVHLYNHTYLAMFFVCGLNLTLRKRCIKS